MNYGYRSLYLCVLIFITGASCDDDGDSGGEDTSWISYSQVAETKELTLAVDQDGGYRIIRMPSTRDIVGKLTKAEFSELQELMTDKLFRVYEGDSLDDVDDPSDCRPTDTMKDVVSVLWRQTDLGGRGGFGCWTDAEANSADTKNLLETLADLTQTLLDRK